MGVGGMKSSEKGLLMAVVCYGLWGAFPLYVYQLRAIEPVSILAFRAVSTLLTLIPIVLLLGRGHAVLRALSNRASLLSLLASATLISVNWGFFFYVICQGQTLQASLAYYVNPLVNVFLAGTFLGERFRKLQWISIVIATIAVAIFTYEVGRFPVWSLILATTFAGYGFVRRSNPTDSLSALTVETLFMFPVALAYLYWQGTLFQVGSYSLNEQFWLAVSGLLTAVPLILFGGAAKRLKFSTLGLVQYLSPTGQFLCAVFAFHETMLPAQWACFGLIWVALIVLSYDSIVAVRPAGRPHADSCAVRAQREEK